MRSEELMEIREFLEEGTSDWSKIVDPKQELWQYLGISYEEFCEWVMADEV